MKTALTILSKIYLHIINARNRRFDKNLPQDFGFKVISVGGIRAGGSGKTPICDFVIKQIVEMGKTPVLFSRGYRRKSNQVEIVPPFADTSWEFVGDEPLMLKRRNPSLWLAINADRSKAAEKLLTFGLNKKDIVGIMDDGFQRRDFARNLDIVVLTPYDLQDKVLPIGRLREPISELKRADIVISQEKNCADNPKNIVAKFVANEFVNVVSGEKRSTFDQEILAFCGIARPERFINSIERLTKKPAKTLIFDDHHEFRDKDYKAINSASQEVLVCTEKDFMRLDAKKTEKIENLWYLTYEVEMDKENSAFLRKRVLEIL